MMVRFFFCDRKIAVLKILRLLSFCYNLQTFVIPTHFVFCAEIGYCQFPLSKVIYYSVTPILFVQSREREKLSDETLTKNCNKVILGINKMHLQIAVFNENKLELERTTTIDFNGASVERICDFPY